MWSFKIEQISGTYFKILKLTLLIYNTNLNWIWIDYIEGLPLTQVKEEKEDDDVN